MLLSSFLRGKGLHPLLDSTVDLIAENRKNIPDLAVLDLDPELKSIYKKIDGDDLFIVNELHKARGFRKLHLEIARIGSSLQILHCVFFPDPRFNLPIFGVDLVATKQGISAAIVDLSPVGGRPGICSGLYSTASGLANMDGAHSGIQWGGIGI